MKNTLLLTLPLILTACTAYDVNRYIPYGVNVGTPAPRPVYINHTYQQPYQQPNHYEHDNYNEHHDNGKHKGHNKHKDHDD
ncbi:MAG: hypothetical protein NTW85_10485 [Methylococcales bacterium]|nr:hypothetical protein [Methylococcales bacterium]